MWRHHNDTFSWVDAVYLLDLLYSFAVFKICQALENTNCYPNKVWDKSKTTWAVGIAPLNYHSVRGGGKNTSTSGLGIFAPTLNLVVS